MLAFFKYITWIYFLLYIICCMNVSAVQLSVSSSSVYSEQKNNAIAVVDLVQKSVSDITGLGMKDWRHLKMDASDQDGGK